jgi:hypothetical protein
MSKKSDDSIERIFRQAITQFDTTFKEGDWLKMEKLLDEEAYRRAAVRSKRIKGTAFTLTGLAGLITLVYFLAIKNPSDSIARLDNLATEGQAAEDLGINGDVKKETPSAGLLSATSEKDSTETQIENNKTKQGNLSEDPGTDIKATKSQPNSRDGNLNSQVNKPRITRSEGIVSKSARSLKGDLSDQDKFQPSISHSSDDDGITKHDQSSLLPRNDSKEIINKVAPDSNVNLPPSDKEPSTGANSSQEGSILTNNADVKNNDQPSIIQQEARKNPMTPSNAGAGTNPADSTSHKLAENVVQGQLNSRAKSDAKGNSFETLQEDVARDDKKVLGELANSDSSKEVSKSFSEAQKKIKSPYHWSVGLVFAPEFSTTQLSHYSTPGESFGLRIGYQLKRVNINTGLIRSTKKYNDDGTEYSPNPGYWKNKTNGVVPEKIDSKCLVWEIPLDVQFDVIQAEKSRVFVATGISSYIMQSQSYRYDFEVPNPGAENGWESSGSESYWFSVGTISAGYERYVHRFLSIGIEPYMKISFAEIGWPNIKLFSTGAYVTLRYRFMNRENRVLSNNK